MSKKATYCSKTGSKRPINDPLNDRLNPLKKIKMLLQYSYPGYSRTLLKVNWDQQLKLLHLAGAAPAPPIKIQYLARDAATSPGSTRVPLNPLNSTPKCFHHLSSRSINKLRWSNLQGYSIVFGLEIISSALESGRIYSINGRLKEMQQSNFARSEGDP